MAKLSLEFDYEIEKQEALRATRTEEIYSVIHEFIEALRSASKHETGPIMKEFLQECEKHKDCAKEINMLDATAKVFYEMLEPIAELLE